MDLSVYQLIQIYLATDNEHAISDTAKFEAYEWTLQQTQALSETDEVFKSETILSNIINKLFTARQSVQERIQKSMGEAIKTPSDDTIKTEYDDGIEVIEISSLQGEEETQPEKINKQKIGFKRTHIQSANLDHQPPPPTPPSREVTSTLTRNRRSRLQKRTCKENVCPIPVFNSRRMNFSEVNQYEWVSDSKLYTRDNKVYYDSLRIISAKETIEIKTGAHIMIENDDDPRAPFIARVDRFFEDKTKKASDEKRVLVDWFLRLGDMSQFTKTSRVAERDEVFLFTNGTLPRNLDAEAIIWQCHIFNFDHRGNVVKTRKNDKHYFCRAQFDATKGYNSLTPAQAAKLDRPRPPPPRVIAENKK